MTTHRIKLQTRAFSHYVYSGRTTLVTNAAGWVTGAGLEGFYLEHTRLLSREQWTADGQALQPISISPVGAGGFLAYYHLPRTERIPIGCVAVEVARFVDEGMRTVLKLENYSLDQPVRFDLCAHLAADFADMDELNANERHQIAEVSADWDAERQALRFRYHHERLDRAVTIHVEQAPAAARYEDGALVFALELLPHQPVELQLAVEPVFDGQARRAPEPTFGAVTHLDRVRRRLLDQAPRLVSTNATVVQAWRTAVRDLASLPLGLAEGPAAPSAGIPIYQQFFGRDTLTIGWQALPAMPDLLRDALLVNAAFRGHKIDDWLDEEPGKMIHQARWGPCSVLGLNPLFRYYGDYATAPDFLIMLGQYLAWTNDRKTVRQLLPAAREAATWLERYADLDGDGFIEYVTRSEKGVKNQGWKDAPDAIVNEHGRIVDNPIATCELQGYWFAGLQQAGLAFLALGDRAYGFELLRQASALKRRFDQAFWMEPEGFYAVGLGPDKRQIRAITSNVGHLLATGIVPTRRARRVAWRLMQPDLFSGWGIRTLSTHNPAYDPFSYHLGSVWPVENATFAFGFGRYGRIDELHRLVGGLFALTDLFVENRLPEAVSGIARDARHPHPGVYPDSNVPQGWSASMVVMLVQTLLGMRALAPAGLLVLDPQLPAWLPRLRLEGMSVGDAVVDLEAWRTGEGETHFDVQPRSGRIRVIRQPPPNADGASPAHLARRALSNYVPV